MSRPLASHVRLLSCKKCHCGVGRRADGISYESLVTFVAQHAGHALTIRYVAGGEQTIDGETAPMPPARQLPERTR